MRMTWPDAYARCGITPAHVRMWHMVLLRAQRDAGPVRLSPVAERLRDNAPQKFMRGKPTPIHEIADHIGYSLVQTHTGLRQLVNAGYVVAIPLGDRKHCYAGNPRRFCPHATKTRNIRTENLDTIA